MLKFIQMGNSNVVVGSGHKKTAISKAPYLYGLIALLVVGAVWAGLVWHHNQTTKKAQQQQAIVRQASAELAPLNTANLAATVNTIQGITGYQKNTDYLYILTVYYTAIGDVNDAQNYLNKLTPLYDNNPPAASLTVQTGKLAVLQKTLTLKEAQVKQVQSGFTGFGKK